MTLATLPTGMSSRAKNWLSETVRSLRARLLKDLREARDSDPERHRLESWLDERARVGQRGHKESLEQARQRHLAGAIQQVAATWLNRAVVLTQMEALGLARPPALPAPEACVPDRVFREWAEELPGLFGPVGLTALLPMPSSTFHHLVTALQAGPLDQEERAGLFRDDTLLGWVYQFWNDPEHEVAVVFTDRCVVEWLMQNSLGQFWLEMCQRNGWVADVVADGTLERLEALHTSWRGTHDQGESQSEDRWKYWVPRSMGCAPCGPTRLRDLKLLDPACGCGHFLLVAFDLLAALYAEEARHLREPFRAHEVARTIVENNLHGIDIDPRAVQIASSALWLKMKRFSAKAEMTRMNLTATDLGLAWLPKDDPTLVGLLEKVEADTGILRSLSLGILESLKGAEHLGSLFKVDPALEAMLEDHDATTEFRDPAYPHRRRRLAITPQAARTSLLGCLRDSLARHSRGRDLALRLRGEQLASGVQLIQMAREGQYHLVVGDPPSSKDRLAGFLERGKALARPTGGCLGLVTPSHWMFQRAYEGLRDKLLREGPWILLLDLGKACVPLLRNGSSAREETTIALRAQADGTGRFSFNAEELRAVPGQPIVYWWSKEFLDQYRKAKRLGEVAPARQGTATPDTTRFLRQPWEVDPKRLALCKLNPPGRSAKVWVPYCRAVAAPRWFEPVCSVFQWAPSLLETWSLPCRPGVAFSINGSGLSARAQSYCGVLGEQDYSVFPDDIAGTLCLLNSSVAQGVLESLTPETECEVADVHRLPLLPMEGAEEIFAVLERAFAQHEQAREGSVDFRRPGPTPWKYAQEWAQRAVDRPAGAPLPSYAPPEEPADPRDQLSYHVGLALGRFGERTPSLPHGILFLSASGGPDSLEHPAAALLRDHASYLRCKFFAEDHLKRYEKRPIYFPLSSEKKNFVAWISIHRWTDHTLPTLLTNYLAPEQNRLAGELADVTVARNQGARKTQVAAQKRHDELLALSSELKDFMRQIREISERGAPCPGCEAREVDAPFRMNLDDGVMINSAALWPLLWPQWKDPKAWWIELCNAKTKKDYDWSHQAARYFPQRVDKKCQEDPSLAVAHGLLWKHHPDKAYEWELRLQSTDPLGPDFRLVEPRSDAHRAKFERMHPDTVQSLREAELRRGELGFAP